MPLPGPQFHCWTTCARRTERQTTALPDPTPPGRHPDLPAPEQETEDPDLPHTPDPDLPHSDDPDLPHSDDPDLPHGHDPDLPGVPDPDLPGREPPLSQWRGLFGMFGA